MYDDTMQCTTGVSFPQWMEWDVLVGWVYWLSRDRYLCCLTSNSSQPNTSPPDHKYMPYNSLHPLDDPLERSLDLAHHSLPYTIGQQIWRETHPPTHPQQPV